MVAIGDVPIADRKRFATCYQYINDKQAIDWATASAAFNTDITVASFKTVTSRALKSATDSAEIREGDLNRFALCYVHSNDKQGVDWQNAAKAYDPKVKWESFRTVVARALRKHGYTIAAEKKTGAAKKKKTASDAKEDKSTTDDQEKKAPASRKRKASGDAGKEVKTEEDDVQAEEGQQAKKKPRKLLPSLSRGKVEDEFKEESTDD